MDTDITTQSGHAIHEMFKLRDAIENAEKNDLLFEFIDFFLCEYNKTKSINDGIVYAESEWDL